MLQHVALEVVETKRSALFFAEILGLSKAKAITMSKQLNRDIFGNDEEVEMETWENEHLCLEVFVTGKSVKPSYQHLCLAVPDKKTFVSRCAAHDVTVITAKKGEKEILFVKDYSGNLYEIKEV